MLFKKFLSIVSLFLILTNTQAATKLASLKVNEQTKYQKITGFGGFVNSPQFGYNYMSIKEIRNMWGKASEAGYNIMRLYLPIGESSWSQSLATAQLAKSLGVKIFASPWSMPAEWKTNNNIAATYTDANGVAQEGSLKEEFYDDYALYLNKYVTYLRDNGVELDAISIQNEPDMKASYAGCLWTPTQMANFIKNYGSLINCKIIAPEGVGITDNYVNAMLSDSVMAEFDLFSGHQYSYIQPGLKKMQAKGKEVWMTEYLINWNAEENTTRNFNWSKDAFTFATKLNEALLANVNAWIHYAAKRFYGLMGDGSMGTVTGAITKRGYILSHFAKYATGTTRIDQTWTDASNNLTGSSYLSATGDSVILMVINPSADSYDLTIDLPFFTKSGNCITTSQTLNMSASAYRVEEETFRPKISISPSSFSTLIFVKSSVRQPSKMIGLPVHPNRIDLQMASNTAFGATYKLTGKTVTLDHANFLISANVNANAGYLKLDDAYNQLVFHVETIASTMNFTSATTTLYYINSLGIVSSHNYGTINFNPNGNFDWVMDISRKVLTDGCIGLLGISNSNYSSILTMKFGDVYFKKGSEKLFKFSGIYSKDDSNLLDCLEDSTTTSLDFAATDSIPANLDWYGSAANTNIVFFTSASAINGTDNVVVGTVCNQLNLTDAGKDFYVPTSFNATSTQYTKSLVGYDLLLLPFQCSIPEGVKAYSMQPTTTEVVCTPITNGKIPANTPVLVEGNGVFSFQGGGMVSNPRALKVSNLYGVYVSQLAPASSYLLNTTDGTPAFLKVALGAEPSVKPFTAYLLYPNSNTAASIPLRFIETALHAPLRDVRYDSEKPVFDLLGRRVERPSKGLYIQNGRKIAF